MTTKIVVHAHCATNKEVLITLNGGTEAVIQDGETYDLHVYDEREVSVRERLKAQPADGTGVFSQRTE